MTNDELVAFQRSVLDDPLTQDVWRDKYRFGEEASIDESRARVVEAICSIYTSPEDIQAKREILELVLRGILVPAGRVNAGAGTGNRVTLLNCFVNQTIQDSMAGINRAIARAALTMQQGGGIGTDFSTVRPRGALVRRTGSVSSGVIPFMDQMSMMCETVVSGGNRRGAMMGVLSDSHPDLWNPDHLKTGTDHRGATVMTSPSFISAKRTPGRMTQFNVSVLVSDAFMKARDAGEDWDLGHHAPRADGAHVAVYDRPFPYDEWEVDENLLDGTPGCKKGALAPWYVYRRVPARMLWDEIMKSTYVYAEPGVMFVDRINERNNLYWFEDIRASNPCGEIPMPPENVCCLSSVNLAFLVRAPFTPHARIDEELFARAVHAGVRFLDNVLDATGYPLTSQHEASMNTRRIGLGVTGWGDALVQLGVRYGSEKSVELSRRVAKILQTNSYYASARLAKERGPFPAYDAKPFLSGWNVSRLPSSVISKIHTHGIRNGVLNTIAPNGTISLYVGNVSSGHEPVYSFRPFTRKVRQPDGTTRDYEVMPYSLRLYRHLMLKATGFNSSDISRAGLTLDGPLPEAFVGATDLTAEEHVRVHCAWQEHLDHAASKTVNCPTSMSFVDFAAVYDRAYELGAKGCTTYRPDPASGRGSVLSEEPVKDDTMTGSIPREPFYTEDGVRKPLPKDALWMSSDGAIHLAPDPAPIASEADASMTWGAAIRGEEPSNHFDLPPKVDVECPNCKAHSLRYPGIFKCACGYAWEVFSSNVTDNPPTAAEPPGDAPKRSEAPVKDDSDASGPPPRPSVLPANSYKIKWPGDGVNWYVTVTNDGARVRELFIAGGDPDAREWVEALARTATAVLRRDGDVRFLAEELERVASAKGGHFVDRVHRPSVVAAIGGVLRAEVERLAEMQKMARRIGLFDGVKGHDISTGGPTTGPFAVNATQEMWTAARKGDLVIRDIDGSIRGAETCPKCGEPSFIREAGCKRCLSCSYEVCG